VSGLREARSWLYRTILRRLEQAAGSEYTILLTPKQRPWLVSKPLADGSTLEVGLSWAWDAPRVVWADRIFSVDGEEMRFALPPTMIRLVVAKDPPRPDKDAGASDPPEEN
jgi:hypothetical protein